MKYVLSIVLIFLTASLQAQTIEEVRAEITRQKLPHPEIVLAQVRLESGNFTSIKCKRDHNIFGLKKGKHYAKYTSWKECIKDYGKRISSRFKGGNEEAYYNFLKKIGYASDPKYIQKLRKIKQTSYENRYHKTQER